MPRTIARLSGYAADDSAFYVDWEQLGDRGRFTVAVDHPLAIQLRDVHRHDYRFTIATTEQFEWHVDKVEWERFQCHIYLVAHIAHIQSCTLSDEYLVDCGVVV